MAFANETKFAIVAIFIVYQFQAFFIQQTEAGFGPFCNRQFGSSGETNNQYSNYNNEDYHENSNHFGVVNNMGNDGPSAGQASQGSTTRESGFNSFERSPGGGGLFPGGGAPNPSGLGKSPFGFF